MLKEAVNLAKNEKSENISSIRIKVARCKGYTLVAKDRPGLLQPYIFHWVRSENLLQCALVGPWSETNGRKLLIVLPFVGQTLAVLVLIVALLLQDLPAEFLLLW